MRAVTRPVLTLVVDGMPEARPCDVCGGRVPKGSRTDKRYCSDKCRQLAYRQRKKEAA